MTLRVIVTAAWTEEIITLKETRNRLWKDREGQDDEVQPTNFSQKMQDAGQPVCVFGLLLPW
jgi:hypothetical protein